MATQAGIVNSAFEIIGAQTTIVSLTDGSPAANAAQVIYAPVRDLLLRALNPAFARLTVAGSSAGAATPIVPWTYEYDYPADCVRVRQVRPPVSGVGSLADPNDPLPIRAAVAFDDTLATPARVVLTNQQNALIVYTSNTPLEANWDAAFAEAMSRRLANPLALAVAGRPDFAREILAEAERYASMALENGEL